MSTCYTVEKTYDFHDLKLSAVFRNWRDDSHCSKLHGYSLGFRFVFAADRLDERNWVVSFGDLKLLKQSLIETFDHALLVAGDDPHIEYLRGLGDRGIARIVEGADVIGAEAFARIAYDMAVLALRRSTRADDYTARNVRCVRATCMEHGANSATYHPYGLYNADNR